MNGVHVMFTWRSPLEKSADDYFEAMGNRSLRFGRLKLLFGSSRLTENIIRPCVKIALPTVKEGPGIWP